MTGSKTMITNDNSNMQMILGLHQICGGAVGVYMLLTETENVYFVLNLIILGIFCFSIFAGVQLLMYKNVIYSRINYFIQIFNIKIYEMVAFKYFLPLSFLLSLDFDKGSILFDFYFLPTFTIDLMYIENNILGLNILGLLIFWLLTSDKIFDNVKCPRNPRQQSSQIS